MQFLLYFIFSEFWITASRARIFGALSLRLGFLNQGLGVLASLGFYHSHPLLGKILLSEVVITGACLPQTLKSELLRRRKFLRCLTEITLPTKLQCKYLNCKSHVFVGINKIISLFQQKHNFYNKLKAQGIYMCLQLS